MFTDVTTITNGKEYFFKSRDRDAIADNSKLWQPLIKLMKEALKLTRILHRYLESDLPSNLTQLPHIFAQVIAKIRLNDLILRLASFLDGQIVANAVALFQE